MPRYRVVGISTLTPNNISFYAPGSVFEDELDPVQEERWLAGGHIMLLKETPVMAKADLGEPEVNGDG